MENKRIIAGLDIGTTKICMIVGSISENGKIEVLGVGKKESSGVSRGVVVNIPATVKDIEEAKRIAEQQSGVEINRVQVGIAGQHINSETITTGISRVNHTDEIIQADIDRLFDDIRLRHHSTENEILHIYPQEYRVDQELTTTPIGMPQGRRIEGSFHVVTGRIASINNIKKCVEKAGMIIDELILEPIASSTSVLTDEEKEAGVVLVDIGGGTTDVAIFYEGILRHTSVIPIGGKIITEDIKLGCSIMTNAAEQLKINYGIAKADKAENNAVITIPGIKHRAEKLISHKNLASIIEARLIDIFEQVLFTIKNSKYESKLSAGLVVSGGGAQMKHIAQLAEYVTRLDTRIGYPDEYVSKSTSNEVKSPIYATGVGLLMEGIKKSESLSILEDIQGSKEAQSPLKSVPVEKTKKSSGLLEMLKTKFAETFKDESLDDYK